MSSSKVILSALYNPPIEHEVIQNAKRIATQIATAAAKMEKQPVLAGELQENTHWEEIKENLRAAWEIEMDPHGKHPNEPGAKLDSGKLRPWLLLSDFSRALEEVTRVSTRGAAKYTDSGWVDVPDGIKRYMDAFGRHLIEAGKGHTFDNGPKGLGPDIYHKAQMIWNLLAALELELRQNEA